MMTKSLPVAFGTALLALAGFAAMARAAPTDSSSELVFGVFTPACFDAFFTHHDFANVDCIKLVVSKALGYAIITGSLILKLPQILKILSAKDVTGLTPASFYMEVLLYVSSTVYNLLRGYPVSTWGENLVILVQNVILVLLLWTFYTPKIAYATRFGLVVVFAALTAGMLLTPSEYQWALASAGIPVSIIARIPQVRANNPVSTVDGIATTERTANYDSAQRMHVIVDSLQLQAGSHRTARVCDALAELWWRTRSPFHYAAGTTCGGAFRVEPSSTSYCLLLNNERCCLL